MASDKVEKEIAKAISNIKNDRAVTRTLLNDIRPDTRNTL